MSPDPELSDTSDDAVLGGALRLLQPRRGHRVGHDAILLAAASGGASGEHAVDLGAGVGAAGLALARRIPGLRVTLVEVDPALAALAAVNAERNGLADRVRAVALDVAAASRAFAGAELPAGSADHVLMNPPFHEAGRAQASPDPVRRRAHAASADTLTVWIATARRLLVPGGSLTLIWRADGLAPVLDAIDAGFGGIVVLPVHARPDAAAVRILVRAVSGSRAPLALRPPLVLAEAGGRPSAAAEAVLRDAVALTMPGA